MEFKLTDSDPLKIKCDVLVLGRFENEGLRGVIKKLNDTALGNVLNRIFEQEKFSGEIGKSVILNSLGRIDADRILITGLGK
ncbi:MAG: M17 family peptidase N-terminal domain-containing protein, partial [Thermodesulfobacteriota bacterium]